MKVGVVSNFDDRLPLLLKNLGIDSHFDFVLTSHSVGQAKPSPSIFAAAATSAGGVDPADCVHVGDSFAKDVVGAAASGWHSVLVPSDVSAVVSSPDNDSIATTGHEYTQAGDLWGFLGLYGRAPDVRIVQTTRPITERGNDGDEIWDYDSDGR